MVLQCLLAREQIQNKFKLQTGRLDYKYGGKKGFTFSRYSYRVSEARRLHS